MILFLFSLGIFSLALAKPAAIPPGSPLTIQVNGSNLGLPSLTPSELLDLPARNATLQNNLPFIDPRFSYDIEVSKAPLLDPWSCYLSILRAMLDIVQKKQRDTVPSLQLGDAKLELSIISADPESGLQYRYALWALWHAIAFLSGNGFQTLTMRFSWDGETVAILRAGLPGSTSGSLDATNATDIFGLPTNTSQLSQTLPIDSVDFSGGTNLTSTGAVLISNLTGSTHRILVYLKGNPVPMQSAFMAVYSSLLEIATFSPNAPVLADHRCSDPHDTVLLRFMPFGIPTPSSSRFNFLQAAAMLARMVVYMHEKNRYEAAVMEYRIDEEPVGLGTLDRWGIMGLTAVEKT